MKFVSTIDPSLWGTQFFHPGKHNIQLRLPIWVHGWCLKPINASGAKMAMVMVPGVHVLLNMHALVHLPPELFSLVDAALGKAKPGQPKSSGLRPAAMWPGEDGNAE